MKRSFIDFLREQRGGQTEEELADKLNELVKMVSSTGKKGKLTLTITVEPLKADSGQMVVSDDVTVKLPHHSRGGSVFYATPENNLTRKDPRQAELNLKAVPEAAPPKPIQEAGHVAA